MSSMTNINFANLASTIVKDTKQKYYVKYFKSNNPNIKNTQKGTKSIINLKSVSSNFPRNFRKTKNTVTNSYEVVDICDYYIALTAEMIKENIIYLQGLKITILCI